LHVWQGGCRWALPMGMWGIYNTAFAIFCKQTILTKVSKFVPDTATSCVVKIGRFQDFSPHQYQTVSVMGNGQCSSIDLWRGFAYQFQFYLGVFFMKQVFDAIACEAVESPSCGWFNIRQMPHNCGLLFSSYRVTTHLNCLVCPWPPNWSLKSPPQVGVPWFLVLTNGIQILWFQYQNGVHTFPAVMKGRGVISFPLDLSTLSPTVYVHLLFGVQNWTANWRLF
jgi:hypothetical protein